MTTTGAKAANLFELRDGKVARFVLYLDRQGALEAVGRRDGDSSTDG